MGVLSGFMDYATRNTDSTISASSTYTNLIGKDRVESFEQDYPSLSEQYELDSDDMEDRNYFQITDVTGGTTFEGYTNEQVDQAVENVKNTIPGVNTAKWVALGVGGLLFLYLARPIFQIIAGVTN